jgi:tripartite ATP-independent transporter DctM subunit
MSGWWLLIAFGVLTVMGIPIAFSLGASCVAFFVLNGIPLSTMPRIMMSLYETFPFLAIPFFALAGQLMNLGGITVRIFDFAKTVAGHIPGGLAHANVVASMIFAGMSGSAVADSAGLGTIEIQAMREDGYDPDFSAAITAASSTVGQIW